MSSDTKSIFSIKFLNFFKTVVLAKFFSDSSGAFQLLEKLIKNEFESSLFFDSKYSDLPIPFLPIYTSDFIFNMLIYSHNYKT